MRHALRHAWVPRAISSLKSVTNCFAYGGGERPDSTLYSALQQGIQFEKDLDKLNQGIITALFIIHAGRGAEQMHPSVAGKEIWLHKFNLSNSVEVGSNLSAAIYLTVPHDCRDGQSFDLSVPWSSR